MFKLNHRESKSFKFSMISLKILRNKVHGRRRSGGMAIGC